MKWQLGATAGTDDKEQFMWSRCESDSLCWHSDLKPPSLVFSAVPSLILCVTQMAVFFFFIDLWIMSLFYFLHLQKVRTMNQTSPVFSGSQTSSHVWQAGFKIAASEGLSPRKKHAVTRHNDEPDANKPPDVTET